jgi:hypothetical protein
MQWAFFRIPVTGGEEGDGLNRFLRSVRVLNLHREFVSQGDASYWAVAVEYLPGEAGSRQNRDAATPARVLFSLRSSRCVTPWHDKLLLGVSGFCKRELASPWRYQAELGNEGKSRKKSGINIAPSTIVRHYLAERNCEGVQDEMVLKVCP